MIKIIQVTKEVTTLSYFFCLLNIIYTKPKHVRYPKSQTAIYLYCWRSWKSIFFASFIIEFHQYSMNEWMNECSMRVSNYDVLLMFTKYKPVKNVKNMWILTNWNIWSLMWSALKKNPTNSYYLGIGYIFKN